VAEDVVAPGVIGRGLTVVPPYAMPPPPLLLKNASKACSIENVILAPVFADLSLTRDLPCH
jgi:hypothetical protein